jgi:tripartite-type tricarboxylate transporter receptor subunit TctC
MPYASTGVGAIGHILFQYIVVKERLNAVAVQYRSGSATVVDLLAGRVKVGTLIWPTARQHVEAGTLIPLGVSSESRLAELPNVPTLHELGYSDLVLTAWTTISGPAGIPTPIIDTLNREIRNIVQRPDMKRHFDLEGEVPRLMSHVELTEFLRAQVERWRPIVRPLAEAK